MDEFDIDDSIDSSFSDDSSMDFFESTGDAFDVMDTVEIPTLEETAFDDIESASIEDFSLDDTEILNNEVDDIMGNVESEELTFDDEIREDVSSIETASEQSIEDISPSSIEAMENVDPEVLEFDDQESYEAMANSETEILQEDGTVDALENIQEQLEPQPEEVEQVETSYDAIPNSETEILQEDGMVDTLETNLENQIENATSVEELTQIRNQILQEGLPEQEIVETNIESQIENTENIEELTQIRNQILQEDLRENEAQEYGDYSEEYIEDKPKTLVREITPEIIESRNADTEEVLDNYRENLREYGVDEDAIEQFVTQERDKINAEYESLDRGDLESNRYYVPTDWEGVAAGLRREQIEASNIEGIVESIDTIIEPIDPSEIDYDEVFEGLDSYDFDGVDYLQDVERLDSSLISFRPERWQELDLNQQKEAMTELAEYVQEVTGLENPPTIEFYNNPVDGDYGGYMASTNTLSINEHMLYDSNEAADTVAHELWHAYQHERAMNPQSAKDYQYQYNFDHYISPKRDMFGRFVNFTEYQDQLVEAEARAFAEQFKGRLGGYSGSN